MCTAPLQVCIDTGSLVRPDKLDKFTDWISGTIAVDLHFVNGHCSFMTETAKVEKMSVCRSYITTIGKTLDLRVGLSFSNVTNERLFVSDDSLIFLEPEAYLKKTMHWPSPPG